jgi:hypothetical protein
MRRTILDAAQCTRTLYRLGGTPARTCVYGKPRHRRGVQRLSLRESYPAVERERGPYDSLSSMSVLFRSSVVESSPTVLIEPHAPGVRAVTMSEVAVSEAVDNGPTGRPAGENPAHITA